MKLRSTTPVSISFVSQATLVAMSVLLAGAGILTINSRVSARDYEAEIRAKQQEANQYHTEATRLGSMADSFPTCTIRFRGRYISLASCSCFSTSPLLLKNLR